MEPDAVRHFSETFATLAITLPKSRANIIEADMRAYAAARNAGKPYTVNALTLLMVATVESHIKNGTPLVMPDAETEYAAQAISGSTMRMN